MPVKANGDMSVHAGDMSVHAGTMLEFATVLEFARGPTAGHGTIDEKHRNKRTMSTKQPHNYMDI